MSPKKLRNVALSYHFKSLRVRLVQADDMDVEIFSRDSRKSDGQSVLNSSSKYLIAMGIYR